MRNKSVPMPTEAELQENMLNALKADAKDVAQMRTALERIRDEAATMTNGGAWAAGIAGMCLGTMKRK